MKGKLVVKFRMLLSALLLAAGIVFVAGCGKKSSEGAKAAAKNAQEEARRQEETRRQEEARRAEETKRLEEELQKSLPGGVLQLPGDIKLELVLVKAGTFTMGEMDDQHRVTLTRDFYLGKTEVTQAQWKAVMGNDPSWHKGNDRPVEQVSWHDAMRFCEKLNEMGKAPKGWKFTLPTEAQWEYAARGGHRSRGFEYSGSNDLDEVAWYGGNSDLTTHPVATKGANELGLYDMSGNVREWCLDRYDSYVGDAQDPTGPSDGSWRVLRGGSWDDVGCRSAIRDYNVPDIRISFLGFRLALVPVQ